MAVVVSVPAHQDKDRDVSLGNKLIANRAGWCGSGQMGSELSLTIYRTSDLVVECVQIAVLTTGVIAKRLSTK